MNKETIEKRIEQLLQDKVNLITIYDGAIQDCQYWLTQLEESKTEE